MRLACIVMASGIGRRFGANKLLEDLAGKPLYQWALDAISPSLFSRVVVVTGHGPIEVAAAERGFLVIRNDRPEDGVSRTIRLGLDAAGDCDGALFMTADQPLLTAGTLEKLTAAFAKEPGCIHGAAHAGQRGNPCLFSREFFPELMVLQGDKGGSAVIRKHLERLRLTEVPAEELFDCDTPEALAICRENAAKKSEKYAKNCLTSI